MLTNAAEHFTAQPAPGGGVRLKLRHRFRDQLATEIDPDGVARSRPDTAENGDDPTEDVIHTFGPLLPGQSAKLVENDTGTIAVVLVSPPDEVLGNTTVSNSGITGDRRADHRAQSYGRDSEARQLADINRINRQHFKR